MTGSRIIPRTKGIIFPFFGKAIPSESRHSESMLRMTLDFISSFIAENFNSLQQKKIYDNFDLIFFKKLGLGHPCSAKFGKRAFQLIHSQFSEEVGQCMENILLNSIIGKDSHALRREHSRLKDLMREGESSR